MRPLLDILVSFLSAFGKIILQSADLQPCLVFLQLQGKLGDVGRPDRTLFAQTARNP